MYVDFPIITICTDLGTSQLPFDHVNNVTVYAQFNSAAAKTKFLLNCDENKAKVKKYFHVVHERRTVLVSRIPWHLIRDGDDEVGFPDLENLIFPPMLGPVKIERRHREACRDAKGNILCYTGRVFYSLDVMEFERIKSTLPTHVHCSHDEGNYHIFLKFDGAVQTCFRCGNAGHAEKDCKSNLNSTMIGLLAAETESTPKKGFELGKRRNKENDDNNEEPEAKREGLNLNEISTIEEEKQKESEASSDEDENDEERSFYED